MHWILIVTYLTVIGANGNTAVTMQEFDTNKACIDASKTIIEMIPDRHFGMKFRCVPKG